MDHPPPVLEYRGPQPARSARSRATVERINEGVMIHIAGVGAAPYTIDLLLHAAAIAGLLPLAFVLGGVFDPFAAFLACFGLVGVIITVASARRLVTRMNAVTCIELRRSGIHIKLPGGAEIESPLNAIIAINARKTGIDLRLRAMGALEIEMIDRFPIVLLKRHHRAETEWVAQTLHQSLSELGWIERP
jgi:hypothetical protein